MKTEIMYDGHVTERRADMLNNLACLVLDKSIYKDIRDAEAYRVMKDNIKEYVGENNIKSHVFLDIKLGNVLYPVVAVGDYGIAVTTGEKNPIFQTNQRIHLIKTVPDISSIKMPWVGHPLKGYEQFVLDHQEAPTSADIMGRTYPIDMDMLYASRLWEELQLRRSMIAENRGMEQSMVFKFKDVYNLLCLYPEDVIVTSPISAEYQAIIRQLWKRFLNQEGVKA